MIPALTINLALELILSLIARSQEISLMITKLRSEGRETFTEEEWAQITAPDDVARKRLDDAIAAREAAEAAAKPLEPNE